MELDIQIGKHQMTIQITGGISEWLDVNEMKLCLLKRKNKDANNKKM